MRHLLTRGLTAASLAALLVLGACTGDGSPPTEAAPPSLDSLVKPDTTIGGGATTQADTFPSLPCGTGAVGSGGRSC